MHIYAVAKKIDWKMFIFQVNAGIYLRSNKYFCKVKYVLLKFSSKVDFRMGSQVNLFLI